MVAPSDMMDNRVGAIKKLLSENGLGGKVSCSSSRESGNVLAETRKQFVNLYFISRVVFFWWIWVEECSRRGCMNDGIMELSYALIMNNA